MLIMRCTSVFISIYRTCSVFILKEDDISSLIISSYSPEKFLPGYHFTVTIIELNSIKVAWRKNQLKFAATHELITSCYIIIKHPIFLIWFISVITSSYPPSFLPHRHHTCQAANLKTACWVIPKNLSIKRTAKKKKGKKEKRYIVWELVLNQVGAITGVSVRKMSNNYPTQT